MYFRLGVFGLLLLIASLGAVFSPPEVHGEEKVHIVQRGETFYSIARILGIKAEDLMRFNGISDPARLQTGQRLRIPGSNSGELASYRVIRGDTLYSISRKFSVSMASILELNGLKSNYLLKEGDSIRLPTEAKLSNEAKLPTEARIPPETTAVPQLVVQPQTVNQMEIAPVNPSLRWPIAVRELSYMTGKLSGVVITGERAESVYSLARGTVLSAGPYRGFGRVVIVQVDGGYLYVYGGCDSLSVKEGDKVGPGAEIGKLGIDAVTNKPQLFFMVYRSNTPVDPAKAPRA